MICIYLDDKLSSKLMEDDQDDEMAYDIFKSLMICIYLDDKLSSKLMEDDQDEMDDKVAYDIYLLRRKIVFQTYGRDEMDDI